MEIRKRPNLWVNQQDLFTTFSKIFQATEGTIIGFSHRPLTKIRELTNNIQFHIISSREIR